MLFDQLMLYEFGYIHKHRMKNLSDFFFVKFKDFSCVLDHCILQMINPSHLSWERNDGLRVLVLS